MYESQPGSTIIIWKAIDKNEIHLKFQKEKV